MPSANPQAHRDASRRWRESHPDAVKEQKRRYYARHAHRLRLVRAPGNKARATSLRVTVFAALGDACVRCRFSDIRALQIDHINGGGRQDRERFANRGQFLKSVLVNLGSYQLLCSNCNWIKRHERREFGTGRPRTITED